MQDSTPVTTGAPTSRPWLTPVLCTAFAGLLITQESRLLLEITPDSQSMVTWPWRLLSPLAALSFALLLPWRLRWIFLGLVGSAASLIMTADSAYFSFFHSVTSLRAAVSLHQLWDVRDSVFHLVEPAQLVLVVAFIGLALFGALGKAPRSPGLLTSARAWSAGLAALSLVVWWIAWRTPVMENTHHIGNQPKRLPSEHWGSRYSPVRFAATFGVVNYHLNDLGRWSRSRIFAPAPPTRERRGEIRNLLERKFELNQSSSPLRGIAEGRHVVILQMESWQQFLVDLKIDGVEVMPFFNALSREGLRFDYMMDVTHLGRTSDAEFAVHTGLLPDVRKPASFFHLGSIAVSMPRTLKRMGYRTASYHGYDRAFWNRAYTHPEWGIEEMYFEEAFREEEQLGLGASDRAVFRFVTEKLVSSDQPAMSFVLSLSSHHPYIYTPREYEKLFAYMDPSQGYGLMGAYLRAVHYADWALGEFIDEMKRKGLHEKTLYVIYGDHDMGGLAMKRGIPELGQNVSSPSADRIPLLIHIPGEEARLASVGDTYRDTIGGLHDLFPTIVHLLGEDPPLGVTGTHLFVPQAERDPLPIPGPADLYVWDHMLHGPGGFLPLKPGLTPQRPVPGPKGPTLERQLIEDMLDHRLQRELIALRSAARAN
ncbi:MAG: LTA synthase family protein [bacterium]|nr:LTA synthase family protein [bacterium]